MTPHNRSGLTLSATILIATLLNSVAAAEETAPPAATAASVAARSPMRAGPLDLRPPNITHLFTSEQLNQILAASFRAEAIEGVEVQGDRDRGPPPSSPTVWGGIGAPFWALLNPTQAWRILAPLPPDQTQGGMLRTTFTDSYLLEPATPTAP